MPLQKDNQQLEAASLQETVDFAVDVESSVSINRFGETVLGQITEHDQRKAEPSATAQPQRMGKYDIIAEIGRGAFGTVYRGLDPQLNRHVAIKVPRIRQADTGSDGNSGPTPESIRQIVRELYDVVVLPGVRRPSALGFKTDEIRRTLTVGPSEG